MRFFFYGTLMDHSVRAAVLQHGCEALRLEPASLPNYRRVRASSGDFPVLVKSSGGRVDGQLVTGLKASHLLRIAHFEGEEYQPVRWAVHDRRGRLCDAWLFLPRHSRYATARAWDFACWQRQGRRRLLTLLDSYMTEPCIKGLRAPYIRWHVRRQIRQMLPKPSAVATTPARQPQEGNRPKLRRAG